MRVLVFNWRDLSHPRAGGAEVYTEEVLARWAAGGDRVTLFAGSAPGLPERETRRGIDIVRGGSRYGVYRAARRFYEREGRGRFDLVIDEVNTKPFGCARWGCDAPVVALIHQLAREVWFHELPLPLAALGRFVLEPRWLHAYRRVGVLTVSESSRESLKAYGLERVTVVPEGVDVEPLPHAPHKELRPTVLFVGRLASNKRPDHALAAFRALRRRVPQAQMWFVGAGPLERDLARRAPAGVTFFGRASQGEKFDLMRRAHVLVVTSVREGWGLVVDEAAAMATPTIGYTVPGLADSVPAAGGVLVPPSPEALAHAVAEHLAAARAPRPGWRGGALPWDRVAPLVRASALAAAGVEIEEVPV